jgi:hypothetical protein
MFLLILPLCFQACTPDLSEEKLALTDAPATRTGNDGDNTDSNISYAQAIQNWKTVEEVNTWIADNFQYDMQRARRLAGGQGRQRVSVYDPAEVFRHKKGVCVDLARYACETLETINPDLSPRYLMIEFEPLQIGNSTFIRHWLIVYLKENQYFVLADTKRPGHISGPYSHLADFIAEYQSFRKRIIVSYKLTDTYKKKRKQKRKKQQKQAGQKS